MYANPAVAIGTIKIIELKRDTFFENLAINKKGTTNINAVLWAIILKTPKEKLRK